MQAMARVDYQSLSSFNGWVDNKVIKQMRYAGHITLRRVAFAGRKEVIEAMHSYFDRPTPYTLRNTVFIDKASKGYDMPTNRVYVTDKSVRGQVPEGYMGPQLEGGPREQKRFEKADWVPSGMYVIPGKAAKLDRYGNMSSSTLKMIGRRLKEKKSKRGHGMFLAKVHNQLGVWERKGTKNIWPVAMLTNKRPQYKKRLPFNRLIEYVHKTQLQPIFAKAFAEAMASAK